MRCPFFPNCTQKLLQQPETRKAHLDRRRGGPSFSCLVEWVGRKAELVGQHGTLARSPLDQTAGFSEFWLCHLAGELSAG